MRAAREEVQAVLAALRAAMASDDPAQREGARRVLEEMVDHTEKAIKPSLRNLPLRGAGPTGGIPR